MLSTVRILDPATGEPHRLWKPLDSYQAMMEAEGCDMILDEVTGIASSRESMGMPAPVANLLVQLRRRDVALRWTAPSWKRADTIIRECSQAVTLCMGFMPQRVLAEPTQHDGPHGVGKGSLGFQHVDSDDPASSPLADITCEIEGPHEHQTDRMWSSKRLFYWRTYDAAAFDEWTAYRKEKVRPMARQLHWRPGHVAADAYDTFDAVLSLGSVSDSGACMTCEGHRQRKPCTCADYVAARTRAPRAPRVKPAPVLIAETDETPAVLVDMAGA